jgi:heme-degrading monooxygenase HmoA
VLPGADLTSPYKETSMYAVVNHLHFAKPVDDFRSALEQEGLPLLSSMPGFRDFYFVKVAEDRAIVIILWQDAAAAESGARAFGPTWFAKNLAPYLASEQQRSAGEVVVRYQPDR